MLWRPRFFLLLGLWLNFFPDFSFYCLLALGKRLISSGRRFQSMGQYGQGELQMVSCKHFSFFKCDSVFYLNYWIAYIYIWQLHLVFDFSHSFMPFVLTWITIVSKSWKTSQVWIHSYKFKFYFIPRFLGVIKMDDGHFFGKDAKVLIYSVIALCKSIITQFLLISVPHMHIGILMVAMHPWTYCWIIFNQYRLPKWWLGLEIFCLQFQYLRQLMKNQNLKPGCWRYIIWKKIFLYVFWEQFHIVVLYV